MDACCFAAAVERGDMDSFKPPVASPDHGVVPGRYDHPHHVPALGQGVRQGQNAGLNRAFGPRSERRQ